MTMHHGDSERPSSKATDEDKARFRSLVPDGESVSLRPMFGSIAAFANGYMFMGLFADKLFVRLDEADTAAVTAAGGGPLEPMPGKPMGGYVTIPDWSADEAAVRKWGAKSLAHTLS